MKALVQRPLLPQTVDDSEWIWLLQEERECLESLGRLEDELRRFEDLDLPQYQTWVRLEFGPVLSAIEEAHAEIRRLHLRAEQVREWIERFHLTGREAYYLVLYPEEGERYRLRVGVRPIAQEASDQARKRAKLEAKRAQRKEARKKNTENSTQSGSGVENQEEARKKTVRTYRELARYLHPDSASRIDSPRATLLWHDVQTAYQEQNGERLLSLLTWIQSHHAPVQDSVFREEGTTLEEAKAQKQQRVEELKRSLKRLKSEVQAKRSQPAWNFDALRKQKTSDLKKLKRSLSQGLESEFARAQEALSNYEEFFDSLGSARAPKILR